VAAPVTLTATNEVCLEGEPGGATLELPLAGA